MSETTVGFNGHEADVEGSEGEGLVGEFVTNGVKLTRPRQASIPEMRSEMYDRQALVRTKMRELVDELGIDGVEVKASVMIPTQVYLDQGPYDVKTTIQVAMKPSKEEE